MVSYQSWPVILMCDSWAFKTDKWDIGFSILYEGTETVVPYSRVNSHQDLQCGSLLCEKDGKCKSLEFESISSNQIQDDEYLSLSLCFPDILQFDNSFSRWRSKIVRYRVFLMEMDNDNDIVIVNGNQNVLVDQDNDEQLGFLHLQLETMSL